MSSADDAAQMMSEYGLDIPENLREKFMRLMIFDPAFQKNQGIKMDPQHAKESLARMAVVQDAFLKDYAESEERKTDWTKRYQAKLLAEGESSPKIVDDGKK